MVTLITGGSGALGSELKKKFPNALFPTHKELDVGDKKTVDEFFKKNDIDLVIHAGAITGIRPCEDNKPRHGRQMLRGPKTLLMQ